MAGKRFPAFPAMAINSFFEQLLNRVIAVYGRVFAQYQAGYWLLVGNNGQCFLRRPGPVSF